MATLHESLKKHFAADATVTVPFFYLVVPQATPTNKHMPCLVFNRGSVLRDVRFCETDRAIRSTVSLDCYAVRYCDARALAILVRESLIDFRGLLGDVLQVSAASLVNETDLVDIEPGLFRVAQSWNIWHVEETQNG